MVAINCELPKSVGNSRSNAGASVFTPIRILFTSKCRRAVSPSTFLKLRSTPCRSKLSFRTPPPILPFCGSAIQYLLILYLFYLSRLWITVTGLPKGTAPLNSIHQPVSVSVYGALGPVKSTCAVCFIS